MSSFLNSQNRIEFTPDPLGGVIDPEGCHCESESDAVMHYLVGSTGGDRDGVFGFVAEALREIGEGRRDCLDRLRDLVLEQPTIASEFIANALLHGNLLEGAGFAYWTTPRGKQWIEIADRDAGGAA